jgi:hypothetical protein
MAKNWSIQLNEIRPEDISVDDLGRVVIKNKELADAIKKASPEVAGQSMSDTGCGDLCSCSGAGC